MNKERVSAEAAVCAFVILDHACYETAADYYLGFACLNLLNTYVKQKPSPINYYFKRKIYRMISSAVKNNPDGLTWYYEKDESGGRYNGLSVIEVQLPGGMQFSFHQVEKTESMQHLMEKQGNGIPAFQFDGIRKQACAVTVFHNALEAGKFLSGKTIDGKSLAKKVLDTLELYEQGKCILQGDGLCFREGRKVC